MRESSLDQHLSMKQCEQFAALGIQGKCYPMFYRPVFPNDRADRAFPVCLKREFQSKLFWGKRDKRFRDYPHVIVFGIVLPLTA